MTDATAATSVNPSSTSASDADSASDAENAFSKSIVVSAIRCTITYVLVPYVFPIIGFGAGVGPWIGLPVGIIAIAANIVSIRRFHRSDHRFKWHITALSIAIIGLLVALVIVDGAELLS